MDFFYYEDTLFRLPDSTFAKEFLQNILEELVLDSSVEIVFCSNRYIEQVNAYYLAHNYPTDIITFAADHEFQNPTLFISVDTVSDNSEIFKVPFLQELFRVIAHGILHLSGYNDSTETEKIIIHNKEDYFLNKYYNVPRGTKK